MMRLSYLLLWLSCCSQTSAVAQTTQVAWIDHGTTYEILESADCHGQVVDAALALVANATEKWKRIVGPDERAAISREQVSFLVRFPTPHRAHNAALARTLDISEIIIPLSGPMAQGRTVVLFADPEFGETNQLVVLGDSPARKSLEKCVLGMPPKK